jgi:hypothetical protein
MTIQQTIKIPANRRVYFDVPQEIPLGVAEVAIIFSAVKPKAAVPGKSWRSFRGMFKTDGNDVERFLEEMRADRELEDAIDERARLERAKHKK